MNRKPTVLSVVLIAAVCVSLVLGMLLAGRAPWVVAASAVVLAGWIAATWLLRTARFRAATVVGLGVILGAGLLTGVTLGIMIVPAAVLLVALIGRREISYGVAMTAIVFAIAGFGIGIATSGQHVEIGEMLAMLLGLVIGAIGGFSRRAGEASREALEQAREEAIAAREAESRIRLARDLHDVLAHSLGGLTLQLDAAEGLLEAGRTDEAVKRVHDARQLAAQGLAGAREAVAALRDPQTHTAAPASDPTAGIEEFIAAHRELGGTVAVTTTGTSRAVPASVATALVRAAQEALSNARRHAPGQPVQLSTAWDDDTVTLTVQTPVAPTTPASPGGGQGLRGMAERFAALPWGGSARGVREGDAFVVTATARLHEGVSRD